MAKFPIMNTKDSSTQFITLYQRVYHNIHSTWKKGERMPSSEVIAVLNHLVISGPLTVSEAAQHFDRAQSAMSELIDRMQANGYIDRMKDSRDKRKTLIWLTQNGRELFDKTQEVLDRELLESCMGKLSEDERTYLINGLSKLVAVSTDLLVERKNKNGK